MQIERAIQQEILIRLRASGLPVLAVPIPNSLYFPARTEAERRIIARIVAQMKNEGSILPGASDLILIWAAGAACVEIKRPARAALFGKQRAGRQSDAQKAFAAACAAFGVRYVIVESWEQVWAHLVEWGPARMAA
jgi:hypothetical protein